MDMSSPVGASGSPIEETLTPRSKVAKMLADIDREIDDAPTPSPPQSRPVKDSEGQNTTSAGLANLDVPSEQDASVTQPQSQQAHQQSESVSDDSSDDDVRRPQGRAARRMLGARQSPPEQTSKNALSDDEDDLYSSTPVKRAQRAASPPKFSPSNEEGNGLFVSPSKTADVDHESEDELPSNPFGSKEKLAELVAQKRAERLAKEAEEKEKQQHNISSDLLDEPFENSQDPPADPAIEKIMSDASRPSRKASKKALLEMERETQRMSRQQALAHQMKVKKKFTTNDFFARFNFRRSTDSNEQPADPPVEGYTTASSAPNSDGIEEAPNNPVSTPPSSPPTPLDRQKELVETGALSKLVPVRQDSLAGLGEVDNDEELPDMANVLKSSQAKKTAPTADNEEVQPEKKGLKLAKLGKKPVAPVQDTSDDELEIIPSLPTHLRVFEKATGATRAGRPADSKAIHNLKHLSHIHANEAPVQKKGSRPSVNPKALEGQLRKRAKEQARQQQLERIEELRAKGIEVQSAEQREQEAEAFENLLEKARQDAVELRKAEKAARKEAGGEGAMQASDDEDEDEDYVGSDSGDDEMGDGEEEEAQGENGLVDEAAEETGDEEDHPDDEAEEDTATGQDKTESLDADEANEESLVESQDVQPQQAARKSRKSRVVTDEDDEDDEIPATAPAKESQTDSFEDPFAAFNFGAGDQGNFLVSPTQAFHATMQTPTQAKQNDSFDKLRRIAPPSTVSLPPSLPEIDTQVDDDTNDDFVPGSQVPESQRINLNWDTQPPETPNHGALNRGTSTLSETPGWEPSQDRGLPSPWGVAPKMNRDSALEEHNTQSTEPLRVSESPAPSQHVPKRGRLGKRRAPVAEDSDDDELGVPVSSVKPDKRDAFREMAKRRREAMTAAEKVDVDKELRGMMEEQAEESEDEYAGLGGDDFVAAETEEDRAMIDSSQVDVDERQIAAHFAERQRLRDEEETSKLYKDLTTGVLRKKMGANAFDLDEDEGELAVRRRQMRQREEAKKRRALLKDENVATLAEGKQSKGKDAFLKAIADDDDGDDEPINLSDREDGSPPATQEESSQSQSQQPASGPLQETSGNKRRFTWQSETAGDRPPAKQRRTQDSAFKRPTSLNEVKESVSFLLDEPNAGALAGPTALELSSDSENEEHNEDEQVESNDDAEEEEQARQNDGGFAPNPASMEAKAMPPPRLPASARRTPAVVDRLSLKRASSNGYESAHGRTAWAAGPATGGFKVPSLLRRATRNTGANERGVTTATASLSRENSGGVRMGGSKKSSLAYQARAEERKAIVEAGARRREENTARIAMLRRQSSGLKVTGKFE